MKKKIVFILLVILIVTTLCVSVGCVEKSDPIQNSTESGIVSDDKKDEDKSEEEPYKITELIVKRDNSTIYGKLYTPTDKKEKMPAVVLSHSAQLTHQSMESYCAEFAKRGFVAYAFDFCGGSIRSKSSGTIDKMTIFTEVADLKAVVESVLSLDTVDSDNLLLFGSSQGGLVSAIAASELNDKVKNLILLYPAFNIPDEVKRFENSGLSGIGTIAYGQDFIDTIKDYDVYSQIAKYLGRVLILHGSKDSVVNKSYSQKAVDAYQNAELYIIKGANHGFNKQNYSFFKNYDSIVWEQIDKFLDLTAN